MFRYYRGCCLDDGDYMDYGLLTGWPSISWWMVPGSWKEDEYADYL